MTSLSHSPGARAASFGRFGAIPVRYPKSPGQEKAYQNLAARLTSIKYGPFQVLGQNIGPFQLFPDSVASEFSSGLVEGVVAAVQSEPAQAAVKAAVAPYVIGAMVIGGLGLAAGVTGIVLALRARRA